MHILLLIAIAALENPDIQFIKSFETPQGDVYLSFPYSMCFSPQGELFTADRRQSRILVWRADGSFSRTIGRRGEGPGELIEPVKIYVDQDQLYVWEYRRQISIFDHQGRYRRTVHIQGVEPRTFAPLGPDRFLIGYRVMAPKAEMIFQLHDGGGKLIGNVKTFNNEAAMTRFKGDNHITIKAFAPEIDIQQGPDKHWLFGFSQTQTLRRINQEGDVVGQRTYRIPTAKPTDEEREMTLAMEFPLPNGERIALKDLPNLKVDFSHNKAYYTHFLVKGDKIAFILTPIGSTDSIGNGFRSGSYYVCDFETGATLSRGSYAFPEDSAALFRNGRSVAYIVGEDNEWVIREIALKGL